MEVLREAFIQRGSKVSERLVLRAVLNEEFMGLQKISPCIYRDLTALN